MTEIGEIIYGMRMRKLASAEGKTGKLPNFKQAELTETHRRVLSATRRGARIVSDICRGSNRGSRAVRNALDDLTNRGLVRKDDSNRAKVKWYPVQGAAE